MDDPRIRELLVEADRARDLLDKMQARGKRAPDVEETLRGIHRDLGQVLHELVRELHQEMSRLETEERLPSEDDPTPDTEPPGTEAPGAAGPPGLTDWFGEDLPDDPPPSQERWYDGEGPHDEPPPPVFRASDGPGDPEGESSDEMELSDLQTMSGTDLRTAEAPLPEAWVDSLPGLLDGLSPADELATDEDLAVELVRLQWTTHDPSRSWRAYPPPLQTALLGLVSSRARLLEERVSGARGPSLALERLRRYRRRAGLPPVVGLLPDRSAESGSWKGDAQRWWTVLVEGVSAA